MLATLIIGALAVVSGSAPLATARPVSADVLLVDAADVSSNEQGLAQVSLRRLQNRRQTARAQRAAERQARDEAARKKRECLRSGNCGGSPPSGGSPSPTFSVASVVTVEEDEQEEVVSAGPKPPVFANRLSFSAAGGDSEPRPTPGGGDGKWVVCVEGDKQSWGPMDGRKPEGITVWANGRCELSEYAGGFDGFWSDDAGDGHEDGFATAVKGMLRDEDARVGASVGKLNPVNKRVNAFMSELRVRADPLDMDYPRDAAKADGGARMANIRKASAVCTRMISVQRC